MVISKQKLFTLLYYILIVGVIATMLFLVYWLQTGGSECMVDPMSYYLERSSQECMCFDKGGLVG